jgi:hypothetical protein
VAYKEKICPKCGVTHNKRGVYCSRSCGNQKYHKPETKLAIANSQANRHINGDEVAEEQRYVLAQVNGAIDPVAPPTKAPIQSNQFVQDGDLWTEV